MVSRHAKRAPWWLFAVLAGAVPVAPELASAQAEQPAQAQVHEATDEEKAAAREAYGAGKKAFEGGDFAAALQSFQASYASVQSPNSLLMVGNCQRELGQRVVARGTYAEVQALAQASGQERYAAAGQSAAEKLAELDAELGAVQVTVEGDAAGARLTVGERDIPADQWTAPIAAEPGAVQVVLSLGERRAEQAVEVAAGGRAEVTIGLPPPPPPTPAVVAEVEVEGPPLDYRTAAYIAGGVGVAGLLTFAIAGGVSASKFSDLEDSCDAARRCPASLEDTADSGATLQTVANVGLFVGALGAIAGATFYLLSTEQQNTALRVGPGGVRVDGRF